MEANMADRPATVDEGRNAVGPKRRRCRVLVANDARKPTARIHHPPSGPIADAVIGHPPAPLGRLFVFIKTACWARR